MVSQRELNKKHISSVDASSSEEFLMEQRLLGQSAQPLRYALLFHPLIGSPIKGKLVLDCLNHNSYMLCCDYLMKQFLVIKAEIHELGKKFLEFSMKSNFLARPLLIKEKLQRLI